MLIVCFGFMMELLFCMLPWKPKQEGKSHSECVCNQREENKLL